MCDETMWLSTGHGMVIHKFVLCYVGYPQICSFCDTEVVDLILDCPSGGSLIIED